MIARQTKGPMKKRICDSEKEDHRPLFFVKKYEKCLGLTRDFIHLAP
jgi:hypothetical protein